MHQIFFLGLDSSFWWSCANLWVDQPMASPDQMKRAVGSAPQIGRQLEERRDVQGLIVVGWDARNVGCWMKPCF